MDLVTGTYHDESDDVWAYILADADEGFIDDMNERNGEY